VENTLSVYASHYNLDLYLLSVDVHDEGTLECMYMSKDAKESG